MENLKTSRVLCTTATPEKESAFPTRQKSIVEKKNNIAKIFEMLDLNKDGQISRDEWNHAIDTIAETRLRSMARSTFDTIAERAETNQPGVITKEDLNVALGTYSSFNLDVLQKSLSRNELSYSNPAADYDAEDESELSENSGPSTLVKRLIVTAEVTVSKIFPAGFGWQGMSVVAGNMGYEADQLPFFLMTGVGDGLGVLIGHSLFYGIKKAVYDSSIDMTSTINTGILLGTAAFHAGTAWQPIVNMLHDGLGLSFNQTLGGTFLGCGTMFYVGLRVGRGLYGGKLTGIESGTYANLKADAALSVSIGGATACFVGTDVSFVTGEGSAAIDQNWLRPVVGIEDGVSDLSGCVSAGTSTALGFTTIQMGQNLVVPSGKAWND